MQKLLDSLRLIKGVRHLPAAVIFTTLLLVGAIIYLALQQLRKEVRAQIAGRDGEILTAVALMEQNAGSDEDWLIGSLDDPASQFTLLLKTSRLRGMIGARLFDRQGKFVNAFPPEVTQVDLPPEDVRELRHLRPRSHFRPQARLSDFFIVRPAVDRAEEKSVPLLEVNIPLYAPDNPRLLGAAQYLIEGRSIAAEYAALDRSLWARAALVFAAASILIVLILGASFYRLQRVNRLLRERTASLLRANQELSLAAKTSAVGAVTAHLLHGLKNPLAGLQLLVTSHGNGEPDDSDHAWRLAAQTTRRMKLMIDEVVRVMRDEGGVATYEISLAELTQLAASRVKTWAGEAGVHFSASHAGVGILTNREANLALLILENLLRNAIEATPAGKCVSLQVAELGASAVLEVRDEGPGLPKHVRASLFSPVSSSKEGGTGVGLAISHQLAQHLGAELTLKSSTPAGSIFTLRLPLGRLPDPAAAKAAKSAT